MPMYSLSSHTVYALGSSPNVGRFEKLSIFLNSSLCRDGRADLRYLSVVSFTFTSFLQDAKCCPSDVRWGGSGDRTSDLASCTKEDRSVATWSAPMLSQAVERSVLDRNAAGRKDIDLRLDRLDALLELLLRPLARPK